MTATVERMLDLVRGRRAKRRADANETYSELVTARAEQVLADWKENPELAPAELRRSARFFAESIATIDTESDFDVDPDEVEVALDALNKSEGDIDFDGVARATRTIKAVMAARLPELTAQRQAIDEQKAAAKDKLENAKRAANAEYNAIIGKLTGLEGPLNGALAIAAECDGNLAGECTDSDLLSRERILTQQQKAVVAQIKPLDAELVPGQHGVSNPRRSVAAALRACEAEISNLPKTGKESQRAELDAKRTGLLATMDRMRAQRAELQKQYDDLGSELAGITAAKRTV